MKKLFRPLLAVVAAVAFVFGCLSLAACGDDGKTEGVDGTYTATVVTDMGDNKFTLILSDGKDAQMNIQAGPINDSYFGTYTAEGNEVSVKGLNNPNNANSATPGLWNDIIDAETGDCEVTLNREDNTFTFKPTGNSSALPELPAGDNVYTYSHEGALGTDTFTLTLGDNGEATMVISNAMFSDTYTGTYTRTDGKAEIKGLTGETVMGVGHPGLFADLIDPETGDCEVNLNDTDNTFTFTPTGAEGGISGGIGGDEEEWTDGTVYEAVKYVVDGTDSQTMNVYVPTTTQEALPLLVTIHGGAFKMGSAEMMSDVYGYFRDKGFVCASLNYTLGEGTYPQGVIDCMTAVQYLVDHASDYKIDSSRIVVMGESAGSTIASLVALSGAADFKAEGAADYTFSVNTYIDFYGPVSNGDSEIGANVDGGVNAWLGENSAVDLSTYFTGMFPCKNIWIQHGDADTSVNMAHAALLKAAIEEYNEAQTIPVAKINLHYSIIEGAGHMDAAFYTDENLGELYDWLCGVYGIVTAELTATYSYSATSLNPITNEQVTDVFTLNLYSDGSCTIGIPEGSDMVKGPFKGVYTVSDGTVSVSGLSGVPGIGYTFVVDGAFTATLNNTDNTFTPVTAE
ncbi:MAG: alpha/beta hydrolase fold domain-containing protein [Candidatus Coproplasma sp.]